MVGQSAIQLPLAPIPPGSTLSRPDVVNSFLARECLLGATCGPFSSNTLSVDIVTSPLEIAHSCSGKPCVVVDLSFPHDNSVNDGIPTDSYLGTPFTLHLPGVDALIGIICQKGQGCHLFKKDLSRTYRQLRIDPLDVVLPFGLCSSAMMCQRTTFAVTYMFQHMGYDCTNYIDNFGGAETPKNSTAAFNALGNLLSLLGL